MKVYKFIFVVGFLNLIIPFMGIPFIYKNYAVLLLAIITLGYALIVRTVEKEKESFVFENNSQSVAVENKKEIVQERKIEDVVEMAEEKKHVVVSDVVVKRQVRKPRTIKEKINI